MAARLYWKGQIRRARVSIPVEIYSATRSGATIAFNQIHEPSGKRIKYEKAVPGIGATGVPGAWAQGITKPPAPRRALAHGMASFSRATPASW